MSESIGIKRCFTSRWGEDGYIVEADFSQLEVIGAAIISQDPNMKQDILDGVDSHSQSASWLNPAMSYEEIREGYLAGDKFYEKIRKNAKAPRFELQYGAGAKSIADNNDLKLAVAKGFIDRYYDRYDVLKAFQDMVIEQVKMGRVPTAVRTKLGTQVGKSEWKSITGRIYTFVEKDSPEWMRERFGTLTSFSPTEAKNYPMQGFATGDIVPEVLGRIHHMLGQQDRLWEMCLPINTIHDSIIFDMHKDILDHACISIQDVMQDAPAWMNERFGVTIDLPMNVDMEYGHSWDNVKHWESK